MLEIKMSVTQNRTSCKKTNPETDVGENKNAENSAKIKGKTYNEENKGMADTK